METTIEVVNGIPVLKVQITGSFKEKESRQIQDIVLQKNGDIKGVEITLFDIEEIDITGIQLCYSLREFCTRNKIRLSISAQLSQTADLLVKKCGIASVLN